MSDEMLIVLSALEGYIKDCACSSRDDEDAYCAACTEVADRVLYLLGKK